MAAILLLTSSPSTQLTQKIFQCLQNGGIIAVPTDSFYALAVSPFNQQALEQLMHIKGDRSQKPFPVLIGETLQLHQLVPRVPEVATNLIQAFWPGLLTLIFPALPSLPEALTGGTGTIGIRQPGDQRLCQLLCQIGPITGTSANKSGAAPATTAEAVQHQFNSEIDLILDGGPAPGGQPSTVLQLEPEFRILRQGAISREQLQQALSVKSIPLPEKSPKQA